ncbi:MAG: fibronectin type III domain-containing protein [Paludibacteraceae bacterium]|nr:fibronectin type III domain-containing protein [Paludibacteraceae bacterium]
MRKTLLSVLLMVMMTVAAFADKEDLYVLHADFEDGKALPEGWTSESVFGAQDWIVEQGGSLDYPAGAAVGNGRVALRNTTEQTQGFITRLITPAMDLTVLNVQPMLIFSHAQAQRLGDVDVLKVFYRTSPEARWIQLAEFDEKITKWQVDTIYLDAYSSKTYQIAFEGTDRFGRGIVLDEIIVRPDIVCEDARDIHARSLSGDEAIIEWGGSLDTDSFEVVVSKKLYENMDDVDWSDTAIIRHEFVYDFIDTLQNLDINTSYYIYIKAYCPSLEGQWVGGLIKTLNKVKVPFVEHFDVENQATDTLLQVENWTYGTSMKGEDGLTPVRTPFLCAYRTVASWHNYAFSGTAMEFGAGINAEAVPAGEYVYMASPEIDIERIQDAYVTFWGTGYIYPHLWTNSSNDVYSGYIIVGVMTNPADYSTFVPVDTCYSRYYQVYDQFQVKFDKYQGEGKYIAFAVDSKDWITEYWVDEVTIGSVKEPVTPVNFAVKDFTPTSAVVAPDLFNATAWNVIASDIKTETPDKLLEKNIIVKAENIPATEAEKQLAFQNMEGKWLYFYVQTVQGEKKSAWSYSQKYMVPNTLASTSLPKTWDFNTKGSYDSYQLWNYTVGTSTINWLPDGLVVHSGHYADVYTSTSTESYAHSGNYGLHLNKRNDVTPYVVFPQLDKVQDKLFTFYYAYAMSGTDYPKAIYEVGVMTDPMDTTTFVPVRRYEDGKYNDWKKGEVDFFGYEGEGKYIAVRAFTAADEQSTKTMYGYIEDVTISQFDDCIKPLNVVATATDSVVTIKWDANGMTKWAVAISEDWEVDSLMMRDTVEANEAVIKNLKPHTIYSYQITTIVGTKTAASDRLTVKTECAAFERIPYKEGFEGVKVPASTYTSNLLPDCWTSNQVEANSSGTIYMVPCIYGNSSSSARSGVNSFMLGYNYTSDSVYAALPLLELPINKLQMTFYVKSNNANAANEPLYIGAMTDPNDIATFDTIATAYITGNKYTEQIINFSKYAGAGKYIAFYKPADIYHTSNSSNHYFIMDDIVVDTIVACEKVFEIKVSGIQSNGATFKWNQSAADKWQVVVSTKGTLKPADIEAKDASIVIDTIAQTNPFKLADDAIEANTQYYVYVRAVCGNDNYGEWISVPAEFKTVCTALDIDNFGGDGKKVEDFSSTSNNGCWIFGKRTSSGTANILNGHIQLLNTTAASDGSYAISRMLDVDSIQYLQVTFDAWNSSTTYPLNEVTVGVISNPGDLSTFVPLDVVKFDFATDAEDHQAYTVRFNDYFGDYNNDYGKFVMFISESGENTNKIELDNIYFDSIPAWLEPRKVWADSVGADAAIIKWEQMAGASSYEFRFADKIADLESAEAQALTADSVRISGLGMLKTYYMQVRAKYGENYSTWSNWRQFTTECPAARPIPYSENFDSYSSASTKNPPECWGSFGSDGTEGVNSLYPTVYSSAKNGSTGNGLYIAGNSKLTSYAVLPRLEADLSKAILAFDYKHSSTSYTDSLWIGVATNAENLDSILNTVVWGDSIIAKVTSAQNVWTAYQRKLEEASNGGQYIVLKANCSYTTSTYSRYGFYIDNLAVEPDAACKKPEDPEAATRELNALGFTWTDTVASQWDVIAVEKGDEVPAADATPAATVDTTFALISNLQPATEYDLYVRANCGGGEASFWVGPVTMKTLQSAQYPYFTDFENPTEPNPANTATEKVDAGWISNKALGTGTGGTYYPYVRTNPAAYIASYEGDKALYFNASGSSSDSMYVVMPVLVDAANNEVSLDSLQVRFQARQLTVGNGTKTMDMIPFKNASDGTTTSDPSARHQTATNVRTIQVGTVTNPLDIKTFELMDAFELAPVLTAEEDTLLASEDPRGNKWWEEISVPFKGAKGKYITILYVTNKVSNTFNIDNLYVEKATGVYAPNAVKGVSCTSNSVTLTWNNRFNAPKFDVGYVAMGGALADVTIVPADKDTFTVTGLEPNKKYDFYVRANYGDTVSNWSAGRMLQTAYAFEQADAAWTFGKDEDNYRSDKTGKLIPSGWKVGNKNNPATTSYIPSVQINNGTTSLYSKDEKARNGALSIQSFVSSTNNSDGAYAIMPLVKGNLDDKELHFWARCCGGNATGAYSGTYATLTYPRAIKVGYVTDPDNIETFVELADMQLPALSSSSAKYTEDASGNKFWNEIAVPLKGMGEGKYIAFLSEYGESNQIYIDQLSIQNAGTCYTPNRPTVDSLGAHAAKFSWQLGEGEWAVLVSTTKNDAQVIRDTVTERSFMVDTLLANTPYIFKVKKLCGGGVESNEASIEFTTNCDLYSQENAVWGFADQLTDMKIGSTTNKVPECWFMSLAVQSSASYASYCPKAIPNTTSVIYAHDGNTTANYALQFYTTATNYDAYAVMPLMDIDKEKTTLHFYGRAAQFSKTYNTTYKTFLNAANSGYLRKLVVGTMTDPNDPETFVAVDTVTYDYVWAVRNQSNLTQDSLDANNDYWQEYTLPLKDYTAGAYIAFKAPQPEAASYFYVDDVAILDAETCTEIGQISAAEITKSSAKLNWTIPQGVENFYVEVSTDKLFEDSAAFILQDTVKALSLELNSLQPAMKYYIRVKHVCSELQQSEFASAEFTTLYAVRFNEGFNTAMMPDNWKLYNYAEIKPATSSSWEIRSSDDYMYGSYASSQILGSWKRWLETPQIDLTDVVAADSIALSFDLASTNKNLAQEDSLFFLVMVSTDGGQTYPTENRIIWGTTNDCNYPFSAISTEKKGTRWYIDLSKYNGQVIRIMFGTDVTKLQGSTGYIYLDNVQLNYYTKDEYAVSICEWTEYEDVNFTIDANDLKVNATTDYEKFTQSVKDGEKDKLARLALTVTGCAETTFEASICEGAAYEGNGFVIEEVKSGTYRRKLQGSNSCDSVATLNLTVLPKQYEIVEKTICQGNYYEFNGVKYYTSTIHSDTLPAANGCDSIVTLYLTVNPILVGETEEVFLCPDSVYYFSEKYPALTEAGIYKDTIQNAQGCDSVISVDIKNVPNEYTLIRAAICDGEVYNKGVFGGLTKPGDYPSQQKTVYGCDSIVTLHLLVATATAEQTYELKDSVSVENLPYVLNDEEILPVGTEEGVYTRTINLNCGEATLVITVGNPQGINNTFVNSLAVMPNPAKVGEPIRVLGDFEDASIEVTSATGALVYTAQNLINPITIPGMPVAGVYLIRLRENDRIYQAKLMVK